MYTVVLLALLALLGLALYAQFNGTLGNALAAFMGSSPNAQQSNTNTNVGAALGIG